MGKDLITKLDLQSACEVVANSPHCVRTPLLKHVESIGFLECSENVKVHLKLENMQTTGSFKARGVTVQMMHASPESIDKQLVTMSAGNYGRAFAYFCEKMKIKGTVVMPLTAPQSREVLIKKMGCNVLRTEPSELMTIVNDLVEKQGMTFLHPFDDSHLISGYGSVGMEILDDVSPDIVLVCCGGGGLLSGVATAVKLHGHSDTRIYGIEPETANTMQLSFQQGEAASLNTAHSIAAGLAPPFAGSLCYEHVKAYVDGIITVSDAEIAHATKVLYDKGLVVEPSGAASFAAILFKKVPQIRGEVVAVVTGGNSTPNELATLFNRFNL